MLFDCKGLQVQKLNALELAYQTHLPISHYWSITEPQLQYMCEVQVYIRIFSVNIVKQRTGLSREVALSFPYLNFHLRSCVVLTDNQPIYYRNRVSERVQKQSRVDQHPPDRCCRFVHWAPLHRRAALSSRPFSEWPKCLFPLKGDCPLIWSSDVNSLSSSLFSSASFMNF